MAFIRGYKPSDFDDMAHICRTTLPPSLSTSPTATRLAPYLWTHQYTHLSPQTCFVLDSGSGADADGDGDGDGDGAKGKGGKAVGYVVGCPSVPDFVAAYGRYVDEVLEASAEVPRPRSLEVRAEWCLPGEGGGVSEECLAQLAYRPDWLLSQSLNPPLTAHPATLHIDLLPSHQHQGWGTKLIAAFLNSVRTASGGTTKGVHVGIAGENARVVGFYEKCGFRVLEVEGGEEDGNIYMGREI